MSPKNEKLEEKKWRSDFMTGSLSYCQTTYISLELTESWVVYIMYHIHYYVCVCVCVCFLLLFKCAKRPCRAITSVVSDSATPWTPARQAPLSLGFFRRESWSGLPCSVLGDLPDPGIETEFLYICWIAGGFSTTNIIHLNTKYILLNSE